MIGLVLRVDAKVCHVELEGVTHALPLRGKLFEHRHREKRPIAVGDRVRVSLDAQGGAIEEVMPRKTRLARKSSGDDAREHLIATNLSLVVVVAAITEPSFQHDLVDRMLAGAEDAQIDAVLVVTKADRDPRDEAAAVQKLYEGLGYRVFFVSTHPGKQTHAELRELEQLLHANESVLCGASGVGKSSLLNELLPGLELRTGEVGRSSLGKHTTSHTQLIPLPGGGHVLDTPGIRGFDLFDVPGSAVAHLFREMRPLVERCKFRDCSHRHEPVCAVRDAVARGDIAASRYASYCALVGGG